jgi:hypothetical protein
MTNQELGTVKTLAGELQRALRHHYAGVAAYQDAVYDSCGLTKTEWDDALRVAAELHMARDAYVDVAGPGDVVMHAQSDAAWISATLGAPQHWRLTLIGAGVISDWVSTYLCCELSACIALGHGCPPIVALLVIELSRSHQRTDAPMSVIVDDLISDYVEILSHYRDKLELSN